MINILKLRKLEKEKNTNANAASEIIDKKSEEIPAQEETAAKAESVPEMIIAEEPVKKKTQKKTSKKVKKEDENQSKARVKKENIEKKKESDLPAVEISSSENKSDTNAEIKELMAEINEIENELKVLEAEDISKEKDFQKDKQDQIIQNENSKQISNTDNSNNTKIKAEEIKVKETETEETKVEEKPEQKEAEAEIDHAEILRQNLLKELLAEETKSKAEVKPEPKKEIEKAKTELPQTEIKPVINKKEVSAKYETPEIPKPATDTLKEKPIEQINQIISVVQKNEFNVKEEQKKKTNENIVQLVGFMLSNEYYGVDIMKIREIIRMVDITKVPRSPKFIEGVINLRGSVIPVINLRTKVRMQRLEYDKNTRIVIVEINGTVVGFIVDAVREVLRIQENLLEPPPSITIEKADYITSVAKLEDQLVILMDTEKVLSNEEGKALTDMSK